MACHQIIEFSTTTEIKIPASSSLSRYYFPQMQNLRGREITGIESFGVDNITKSPNNVTTTADNVLQTSYITLITRTNNEAIYRLPVVSTNRTAGASSSFYQNAFKGIQSQEIDWEKSYLEVADTSVIAASDTAVTFTIYYS